MSSTVCIISADTNAVLRFNGIDQGWTHIGAPAVEPAVQLFSGDWGLIARKGVTNETYKFYDGKGWEDMGGPRGVASVGTDTVYAVPRTDVPDMPQGVYQFDGHDDGGSPLWSKIGPPNQGCLAGKWGVVGFRGGVGDDFYHYTGIPNVWVRIGGGTGTSLMVVGQDTVYSRP